MKLVLSLLILYGLLNGNSVVLAQSVSVDLRLITPATDVRRGGDAKLRCSFIGVGLSQNPIVEWRTSNKTLVWHGVPYVNNIGVSPLALDQTSGVITQHLDISRLKLSDAGTYICNVRSLKDGGGSRIEATDSVYLNVTETYFPASTPVCAPSGAQTVSLGDVIPVSCTSEPGRPPVRITLQRNTRDVTEMFVAKETIGNLVRSLDLTVRLVDDGVSYKCSITSPRYFPELQKTCTIGPFTVLDTTKTSIAPSQTPPRTKSSSEETTAGSLVSESPQNSQTTIVIALAISLGALIVLFMIACVMLFTPAGLFQSKKVKKRSRVPAIARVHPEPNACDGRAMSLEVFTTQEGVTDYAYAITDDENKSDSDACSIPMYSVVMGSRQSQDRGTTDQESSPIVSDQERPVMVNKKERHKIVTDVEMHRPTVVAEQEISSSFSDPDSGFPTMCSDEEIHVPVSVSSVPWGQASHFPVSPPLPSPAPPPPPPYPHHN